MKTGLRLEACGLSIITIVLPMFLGFGLPSCTSTRDIVIYKYVYKDNLFWRSRKNNQFLTPDKADGLKCTDDAGLQKIAAKLEWCAQTHW